MVVRGDEWGRRAARGSREVENRREHEALIDDLSTYALAPSSEVCDNGSDDDGDRLSDCADPSCAAACGAKACVTDDVCPCGSDCVNGACTAVGPFCDTDADCSGGMRCGNGRRHGQECNASVCQVKDDDDNGVHGGNGRDHPEDNRG